MSKNRHVTKAASIVGTSTFISRVFGYIRDMAFAGFFGAGMVSDAFIAAFQIPNLLRRLFGEGSLSIAFVPVFTEYLTNHGKKEAFQLAGAALRLLSAILAIIAILGIILSPIIVKLIAPGFTLYPETYQLTVTLTQIMFPYVFFICLVALCMGILNALDHFSAPAFAPVLLNISMIGSLFLVACFSNSQMYRAVGLAVGVVVGGILQLSLQIPFLIKKGFVFWQKTRIYHPSLKKIGVRVLPAIFGAAAYQINIIVGRLLASLLSEGSISYLYYADRLVQFPLGVFAIATATAALPTLAKQSSLSDTVGLNETFIYALNLVFFIAIPAMTGLIILREPIVELLFQRGAFDVKATHQTATALLYYGVGLWAVAGVRIVVSVFYAIQDTKTPVKMAAVSVAANILLSVLLMVRWGHGGIALAASIASILNLAFLIKALSGRLHGLKWRSIIGPSCKTVIGSVIMGSIVWVVSEKIGLSEGHSFYAALAGLVGCVITGIGVYIAVAMLMKSPFVLTLEHIIDKIIRKR